MLEWLLAPIDVARLHDVGFHVSWHARFMVLAWGVLLPLGIITARFFKIVPGQAWPEYLDNQAWWHAHRVLQYAGCALMLVALFFILNAQAERPENLVHRLMGWTVICLAVLQILAGLLRGSKGGPTDSSMRGDHYDMTLQRRIFEYVHKLLGYLVLLLAWATTVSGLWTANAPPMDVDCHLWLVAGTAGPVLRGAKVRLCRGYLSGHLGSEF